MNERTNRLARVSPVWLFMLAVAILAAVSMFLLAGSGTNRGLVGFLGGAWLCVLVGFAFWVWRRGELRG